jgi:hypothetical protein
MNFMAHNKVELTPHWYKGNGVIVAFGDIVEGMKFTTLRRAIRTNSWIQIDHI